MTTHRTFKQNIYVVFPCSLSLSRQVEDSIGKQNHVFSEISNYSPPVSIEGDKLRKFTERLSQLSTLEYNWDGYHAIPVSQIVIDNVVAFLLELPFNISSDIAPSDIAPSPYGTIFIEIEKNGNDISIEIGMNEMSYIAEIDSESYEGEDISPSSFITDSNIVDYLKKIL